MSQRIEDVTGDFFTKTTTAIEHDVAGYSTKLYLRRRCTAVTAVNTRGPDDSLTLQPAASYRLNSSLDAAGAVKVRDSDYLEITYWGGGLVATYWGSWVWPLGTHTVQVTGDFGWTTTPGDIKRACALMVWDLFYKQAGDLQRAKRFARGDITVEIETEGLTGIPEADGILKGYMRGSPVMIG